MILYHFDLYPRTNPRDGARVVRFTKLQSAEYRGEANGTGSGKFTIRADDSEAQLIDPLGLQYVRVVREDTVAETEAVVGGFWLDEGDFALLDTHETRLLSFGGAGTLAYLSRAAMAPHTYVAETGEFASVITQDPFDDIWRLYAQGPAGAVGTLGAMLYRVVVEAQAYRTGATYTHKHADGEVYTDSHDNDRTGGSAIPQLVIDFEWDEDTNGNPWTADGGEFKAQITENVLAVVKRLMEAGLYVYMDPDTFELQAWENNEHRRDRTGGAWGASVVRFQAPTDGTVATGNIKSDAKRKIVAFIKRTLLWVGGSDVYGKATAAGDVRWEGGYYSDANDVDALEQIGSTQINARADAGDTLRLRGKLGTDTSSGYYRPFEDARLDDLATVHTGTDQFDHDEQDFPIAAITVALRQAGDWDVWYDLGSSYSANPSRQFQVSPVPAHNHPPNLCLPGTPSSGGESELFCWDGLDGDHTESTSAYPSVSQPEVATEAWSQLSHPVTGPWVPSAYALLMDNTGAGSSLHRGDENAVLAPASAGDQFRIDWTSTKSSGGTVRLGIQWVSTASYPFDFAGDTIEETVIKEWFQSSGQGNVQTHSEIVTAPIGATGFKLNSNGGVGTTTWRFITLCITQLNTGTPAVPGDGHPDLVGTSTRAARCDHSHTFYSDRAPNSDDDETEGFIHLGIRWVNTVTGEEWRLDDTTEGAAVWTSVSGGEHDHTLAGLDDVDLVTTPPSDGDVLTYDATDALWLPAAPTGGGGGAVVTHGAMGSTETFDASEGSDHEGTLDDDVTITLTGATDGTAAWMTLALTDSGGPHTITWPGSVIWPGGVAPDSPAASETLVVSLFSYDGGTTWYGAYPGVAGAVPTLDVTDDTTTVSGVEALEFDPADFDVTDEGGGTARVSFVGSAAGRWEVLLTEDGSEPITTEDGLDWIYVEVFD